MQVCCFYSQLVESCFFIQKIDYIDVATGSLGQGLSMACGMAYAGKYIDKAA